MEMTKPLSVKFDPIIRQKMKRIACLLDWPEGQFVNAAVGIVLELIEDRSMASLHKTIFLAQQALEADQAQFTLNSSPHASRQKVVSQ